MASVEKDTLEAAAECYQGYSEEGFAAYQHLYTAVIKLFLPPKRTATILDLGCGSGGLAGTAQKLGYKNYTGVDFSIRAIKEARKKFPDYDFILRDITVPRVQRLYQKYNNFVCLETLEHIKDDFAVIRMLKKGCRFIFSVPSFDSKFHVRYFPAPEDVIERYKKVLKFNFRNEITLVASENRGKLFVFKTIKK